MHLGTKMPAAKPLILFSVKREFSKLFFVTRDLKVLRDS